MKRFSIIVLTGLIFWGCQSATTTHQETDIVSENYEYPFRNHELSIEERVDDLVGRLTLEEKILQLFNDAPAIDRLGIPSYNWWNEALHGVARAGKATVFPQAIGMASTFNEELMLDISTAISDEGRAKHHHFEDNGVRSIYSGLTFWSPNINIFRDPRWGRGQETYGEDPYLTGRMAVNFIKGLQGDDPKYFKSIATAKHYAVHSGPEYSRHSDNFYVNDRDLYQTYLPAFKMAVEDANVYSIMCAYNRFRDRPCCGSDLLLDDILRKEFGFEGYVVTDCGAITDFYKKGHHEVVETPSQAMGWALASGTDLNCEMDIEFIQDNLQEAVANGVINEANINRAVKRLFTARFKLGMFDPKEKVAYAQIPMSVVGSPEHQILATKAAEESFVLLKNNDILPLAKSTKIALIGPNADNEDILLGNYNGLPIAPITPKKGLESVFGKENVMYAAGSPLVPTLYGNVKPVPSEFLYHDANGKIEKGLKAEYYKDVKMIGNLVKERLEFSDIERDDKAFMTRVDPSIDFLWETTPISGKLEESFAVRWTGKVKAPKTATYRFSGNLTIKMNGEIINGASIDMVKDQYYDIEADYVIHPFWWGNTITPHVKMNWVELSKDYTTEAIEVAKQSDVIVFCGGISPRLEGEEMKIDIDGFAHGDRTHLQLPQLQKDLLQKLYTLGKPIVYVNFSGSALALNWNKKNADAILQGFYPGEKTGIGLANIISGKTSPSGRLPITFYQSVDDLPDFTDYAMKGRTYRYFEGTPLYPFGYGLSYHEVDMQLLSMKEEMNVGQSLDIELSIENKSNKAIKEVVQVYLKDVKADVTVPLQSLASFKKVSLEPNEKKDVKLTIDAERFELINKELKKEIQLGTFEVHIKVSDNNQAEFITKKVEVKKSML
ncbi:glycoside hydrolase family 3 C-terminal domain-containing protein [Flammeovirga yaeyamensis]|uniref:Glycoside hydrolase family 3 C-terminal domain-containing protein n=1 Tax=Flammeovirga yaeyamensis TaxID=367791 RepID=A0AAX1NDE1_9BACT|nr:glycoside hydrolase family 3 C-terminal domain-containing protein [Flammeovirga yaeyamensis]MBB3699318.1 beta-glucosidase [Flammeovirga yaeyamensis]NMF35420.1 beta-glucosidase [Flammeovirga yaeyamensis]QWG04280.1 glycoside hydrolase family 3 C-terminal domain-containing protein [Flammeovirga yaeyamensis]